MVWALIIGIIVIILFKFFTDLNKDNDDLRGKTASEKFQVIVGLINEAAFAGAGAVIPLDKRNFNLYEKGQNQIISFMYSTGHLTITWKYKYFQKEIKHEKQYRNVRNLSIFEQQKIAEDIITEMDDVITRHKLNVLKV